MSVNENIAQPSTRNQQTINASSNAPANDVDLMALFGALIDRKYLSCQ